MNAIEAQSMGKRYGRHVALEGLCIRVPQGSAYALLGTNGAGKTTAIKCLMNLLTPDAGSVTVLGKDSRKLRTEDYTRIGYVSESLQLPERLTAGEYLAYLRTFYPSWDVALEHALLHQLQLKPQHRIGALSRGMRMKLMLIAALAFRPRLLVLDEPLSGLDPLMRDELLAGLIGQAADTTVLISSHELNEIEGLVTHIGYIEEGRMRLQGETDALIAATRSVRVRLPSGTSVPTGMPATWIDRSLSGNTLQFVDSDYNADEFAQQLRAHVPQAENVDVEPMGLRAMFVARARHAAAGSRP